MNDPKEGSPTGRLALNDWVPKDCPFCEAGHPTTTKQSVIEVDFSGVELRVVFWSAGTEKMAAAIEKALQNADSGGQFAKSVDSMVYTEELGRILRAPSQLRADYVTQPVTALPVPAEPLKRKNAPKGKRGRAQWWNK